MGELLSSNVAKVEGSPRDFISFFVDVKRQVLIKANTQVFYNSAVMKAFVIS